MTDILQHIVDQLPAIITSITGAYVVIRQTNRKTEKEAAVTNLKVETVQQGVNGNLSDVKDHLATALNKIDTLNQSISTTAVQTEVDKATALDKKDHE